MIKSCLKSSSKKTHQWISDRTAFGLLGLTVIVIVFKFILNLPNCKISGPRDWMDGDSR